MIDLLQSPSCQGEDQSTRKSPTDCPVSSLASRKVVNDVGKLGTQEQPLRGASVESPKLGDFGSLWELLGTHSTSTASKGNTPGNEVLESTKQSCLRKQPTIILKRLSAPDTLVETPVSTSKPAAKPAPVFNFTDTYDPRPCPLGGTTGFESNVATRRRSQRNKTNHDATLSESNAEGESDSSPSVFDNPLSRPQNIPMIPPQVGVSEARAGSLETPPSSFDELNEFLPLNPLKYPPIASAPRLRPLTYKAAADQRVGLLTKLLKDFPDYAEHLVEAGRSKKPKKHDLSFRPVHVFVDMSNIMVGFHDTMKISRNIPVQTRIRRLPLSYQNFSLILERGRPAAKRVLVGSDRIAAISESEQLGYEANILSRVQKIKQLTSRQLKFRKNPKVTPHDGGHSSETNDGPGERWVEQGVDEILHLKILESLLDTDEPATIVLATGDAAEAEFSGGFMRMVERALQRGWRVELVSFSQVTSYAYQRKEFRSRWGNQFLIIALDDYVEELLNM